MQKKKHLEYLKRRMEASDCLSCLPHGVEVSRVHPADNGEIVACESRSGSVVSVGSWLSHCQGASDSDSVVTKK